MSTVGVPYWPDDEPHQGIIIEGVAEDVDRFVGLLR